MNLTCVIVDDEYLAIKVLKEYASRAGNLDIENTFTKPSEAVEYLRSHPVDILLLDIQMPEINGFELLKKLTHPPMVIFTTARHDYAVQAYELDVLDYLVKPIPFERFEKAISKAAEYKSYKMLAIDATPEQRDHLMIKADYRIHKVLFSQIEYIEGFSEYVKIHTPGKVYVPLAALKELSNQLPPSSFARIHKSYIVSIRQVDSYTHQSIQLKSGVMLPIGRSYKVNVIAQLTRRH